MKRMHLFVISNHLFIVFVGKTRVRIINCEV